MAAVEVALPETAVTAESTTTGGAPPPIIAPSVLASDFACLASEAQRVVSCGADWLHLDVMDGNFVPNLTFGPPIIECLRKHTDAFFDCHVMVSKPEDYVEQLAKTGANSFTFHLEATEDPLGLVKKIKAAGMKAAVALSPHIPVEDVFPLVDSDTPVEMVLVMTVKPGFGGQKFMADMMPKVQVLRERYPNLHIQVDGGLGPSTVDTATAAGANVIVAGTAVFHAPDPQAVILKLRESVLSKGTSASK